MADLRSRRRAMILPSGANFKSDRWIQRYCLRARMILFDNLTLSAGQPSDLWACTRHSAVIRFSLPSLRLTWLRQEREERTYALSSCAAELFYDYNPDRETMPLRLQCAHICRARHCRSSECRQLRMPDFVTVCAFKVIRPSTSNHIRRLSTCRVNESFRQTIFTCRRWETKSVFLGGRQIMPSVVLLLHAEKAENRG